jgi:hypothetical protein
MATTALATMKANSVTGLKNALMSARGKLARLNEKAGETIEGVVKTLEIQGAAFVFGAIQGAWYEPDPSKPDDKPGLHVLGMPVEGVVGVGLMIGGFVGLGGDKWAGHLINFGNGALAAYTSNLGRGFGYKFKKERDAKKAAGGSTRGQSLREEVASLLED